MKTTLPLPHREQIHMLRAALQTVLDAVDYTHAACRSTEPVGAVLPRTVLEHARETLAKTKGAR